MNVNLAGDIAVFLVYISILYLIFILIAGIRRKIVRNILYIIIMLSFLSLPGVSYLLIHNKSIRYEKDKKLFYSKLQNDPRFTQISVYDDSFSGKPVVDGLVREQEDYKALEDLVKSKGLEFGMSIAKYKLDKE